MIKRAERISDLRITLMEAHVRRATRAEANVLSRPFVCAVNGQVVYRCDWWSKAITDTAGRTLLQRWAHDADHQTFRFPDGTALTMHLEDDHWYFDGHPLREEWPTTQRRILRAGERVIKVRPEDDTLSFDFTGETPPHDLAVMALLIKAMGCA